MLLSLVTPWSDSRPLILLASSLDHVPLARTRTFTLPGVTLDDQSKCAEGGRAVPIGLSPLLLPLLIVSIATCVFSALCRLFVFIPRHGAYWCPYFARDFSPRVVFPIDRSFLSPASGGVDSSRLCWLVEQKYMQRGERYRSALPAAASMARSKINHLFCPPSPLLSPPGCCRSSHSSRMTLYRRANPPAQGEKKYDYHGIQATGPSFCAQVNVVDRSMKKGQRVVQGPRRPTQQLAAKDADR